MKFRSPPARHSGTFTGLGTWYLVPFGTVAIVLVSAVVLLSRILSMMPCEGPAARIAAANAVPTTVVVPEPGPALATEPVAGWPAPAAAGET